MSKYFSVFHRKLCGRRYFSGLKQGCLTRGQGTSMVRLKSFQFFYWLVVITFVGLMGLVTFIRPLDHKQQELLQAIDREQPLVLLENDTTKVSNNQNESLFNETTKTITTTIEVDKVETTIKPVENKIWKKAEKPKKPMVTTTTTTTEEGPSLVKEDFTTSLKKVKIGKKVNITYDSPIKYKGPIVEGWPPDKDRYMPHYIHPDQDTFSIRPSKAKFKGCQLLIVVHSALEAFHQRQSVRETWIHDFVKYRQNTDNKIQNVSVIFLVGNQNGFGNFTLKSRLLEESAKFDDILQADMVDHYNNLTLKSVFTLKFFLNTSNFDADTVPYYLMKVDNDVYLNVPQLVRLLEDKKLTRSPMFLVGHRFGTRKKPPTPIRVPKSRSKKQSKITGKWWVPKYLFNGSRYPVIISGSGYVTTRPAAQCLYENALHLPFFHLEDVFLTGFAAENCVISRFHCDGFHPQAVRFTDLKETDILWHYLSGKSLGHMQRIFKYEELLQEYQKSQQEIVQLKKEHRNDC